MKLKLNTGKYNILIAVIVLIISVLLLIDRLLATGPVQLVLENGQAVPIEGVSYFSLNEVLLLIITAWLGGMSFLYIFLLSNESEAPALKENVIAETKNAAILAVNLLVGDEKILLQKIIDGGTILQRELILKTGFSEPKVSRLLDKLEKRGLIIRQRDGMGNKVLIK
ncbi:MAG: winged helix-turn-helix transcriptional regulator [Candidatus Methanoperedens sp.]|nr:winged helix-turn-helix transcriptional regulator [Candidatus Methanoperedens sp.]MCZ7405685.1 winged helix-turn-helix transcriptional regulator [Candidatus Methanoperedens sp.]